MQWEAPQKDCQIEEFYIGQKWSGSNNPTMFSYWLGLPQKNWASGATDAEKAAAQGSQLFALQAAEASLFLKIDGGNTSMAATGRRVASELLKMYLFFTPVQFIPQVSSSHENVLSYVLMICVFS